MVLKMIVEQGITDMLGDINHINQQGRIKLCSGHFN